MSPKLSVILPFYNADTTLKKAVESVLEQTFSDFELLLIDNNSVDKSLLIANSFVRLDDRVKILSEKKQGVSYAMNKGIISATGEYIARMDADDISMPNRFEKQITFMDENQDIGLCGSLVKYISHFENTEGFRKYIDWNNAFFSSDEISLKRFIEIPIINPTILFRTEIAEKLGGCRHGDFPEDYEMQLRFLGAGIKMYKLPEVLLEWHDYPTRLTRIDDRYSTEAFFRTKAKYFFKWSKRNNKFHPTIWNWGAGRKTRKDGRFLEKEGLRIVGYYDINEGKTTTKPCYHYSKLPDPGEIFVVSMVAKYGAREQIRGILKDKNYKEGKDYVLMA